jgi:hypothetical protein
LGSCFLPVVVIASHFEFGVFSGLKISAFCTVPRLR